MGHSVAICWFAKQNNGSRPHHPLCEPLNFKYKALIVHGATGDPGAMVRSVPVLVISSLYHCHYDWCVWPMTMFQMSFISSIDVNTLQMLYVFILLAIILTEFVVISYLNICGPTAYLLSMLLSYEVLYEKVLDVQELFNDRHGSYMYSFTSCYIKSAKTVYLV